jgi:hypothetical protein
MLGARGCRYVGLMELAGEVLTVIGNFDDGCDYDEEAGCTEEGYCACSRCAGRLVVHERCAAS